MNYEVGMRWIWKNEDHFIIGYISQINPNTIAIECENGRVIRYPDFVIKNEPRLSLDREWYRNEKLKLLGI